MRIINQKNETITEYDYDLEKGKLVNGTFKHKDGTVEKVQIYVLNRPARTVSPKAKISKLKDQLAASDYKVIKCIESYLAGEELPYDINELHQERDSVRKEINKLEEEAKQ
jgi:hypothetical protein